MLEIFRRQEIYRVWPDDSLADVLKAFKRGHAHLAIVTQVDNSGEVNFSIMKTVKTPLPTKKKKKERGKVE